MAKAPSDIFLSPVKTVHALMVESGQELNIRAILNLLVVDLALWFQVGRRLEGSQVPTLVQYLLDDYKHFKLEDFKACFEMAKRGHYGQVFDRVDGPTILNWLKVYDEARTAEIERIRNSESQQYKREELKPLLPPAGSNEAERFERNMKQLRDKLAQNKADRQAVKDREAAKELPKGEVYDMHQRWFKQFDKLWQSQGYPAKRFIRRFNRMIDINFYLDHKQRQYARVVEYLTARYQK